MDGVLGETVTKRQYLSVSLQRRHKMFERLINKTRRGLAFLIAVALVVTGTQMPVFAETVYQDTLDGWKVQAAWNTLSTDYEWNAMTDSMKQPKIVVTYRMDHAERDYPAGSLSFTIPGIGGVNRDSIIKADKLAADQGDSEWAYEWNEEQDLYVFTNKFEVKEGQSVSGGFELLWTLDARECENGFIQEKSPLFSVKGVGTINLEPLSFSFTSKRDLYRIYLSRDRLNTTDYEDADHAYVWYDFTTQIDFDHLARGLYRSNYFVQVELPDKASMDDIKILYNGNSISLAQDENGNVGFYLFKNRMGSFPSIQTSQLGFQLGFKQAALEGQDVTVKGHLDRLYYDESDWTHKAGDNEIVDVETTFTIESYRFTHQGYIYNLQKYSHNYEEINHSEPHKYTDRLNAVNLYNGKVVSFQLNGKAMRNYATSMRRRMTKAPIATVSNTASWDDSTPSNADWFFDKNTNSTICLKPEPIPDSIEDWNDIHWNENGLYEEVDDSVFEGATYADFHGSSIASPSNADDDIMLIPDIDWDFGLFGKGNPFLMKAYAAELATPSVATPSNTILVNPSAAKPIISASQIGEDQEYSLVMGDDKLAIFLNDGTIRPLEDEEYDIVYVTLPSTSKEYDYEVYGAITQDTIFDDYVLLGVGNTRNKKTLQLPTGIKAVFIRVNGITGSYTYSADIGVRLHLDWEAEQMKDVASRPDHENRVVNFSYLRALYMNEEGVELNDCIVPQGDYDGTYGKELADRDEFLYQELMVRDYSNIWLRSSTTGLYVGATIPSFEGSGKTGFTTNLISNGTIQAEDRGSLEKFSLYTVIPEGLQIDLDNAPVTLTGTGTDLNGSTVQNLADYATLSIKEYLGKAMIVADFDCSNHPLQAAEKTKIHISFPAKLSYADYLTYGNKYVMETFLMAHDDGLDKISGPSIRTDEYDLNENGNVQEKLAYTNTYGIVLDDATEWREYISKYVQSAYSKGYVTDTVTRLYSEQEALENQKKSLYEYRLDFGLGSSNARNIVFFDRIEQGAEIRQGETLVTIPSEWQGTFVGVDTSKAKQLGLIPTIYYSTNPAQEFDLSVDGWSTDLPEDPSVVKSIAVSLDTSMMPDGLMKTRQMTYVIIQMQAPSNRDWIEKTAVNQYVVRYDAYGLTDTFEDTYELSSAETYIKLLDNIGKIVIQKVDADNPIKQSGDSTQEYAALTGAKFQIYDPNGLPLFGAEGKELNSLGRIVVNNVRQGTYSWEEVAAPIGYEKIEGRHSFEVDGVLGTIMVENKRIPGQVTLTKQDRDNLVYGPLAGAEFELYRSDDVKVFAESTYQYSEQGTIDTFVTKEDGTLTITGLPWGDYYFKEVNPPQGYLLNTSRVPFSVGKEQYDKDSNMIHVDVELSNKEQTASLLLKKVDSVDYRPIKNATFSLYQIHPDGDKDIAKGLKTNAAGELLVENLKFGSYYFVETRNAGGYQMPDAAHAKTEVLVLDATTAGKTVEVTMTNDRITGSVVLTKKDETGQLVGGATYGLYYQENESGQEIKIGSYTTDENRQSATFGEVLVSDLVWGSYYFLEEQPPMGYELNPNKVFFTIDRDTVQNRVYVETIDSLQKGSIKLVKVDRQDYTKKLEGAVYELFRTDGTKCVLGKDYDLPEGLTEIKTGVDGTILISNIEQGGYYLKELVAPMSYSISAEMIRFSITKENASILQEIIAEDEIGKATIKVNKEINEAYDPFGSYTFVFTVTRDDGENEKKSITLSEDSLTGSVTFVVDQGHTYTITEKSVSRYVLDTIEVVENATIQKKVVCTDLTTSSYAEVTFKNVVEQYEKFNHATNATNIVKAYAKLTGISVDYIGPNPITQELPGYDEELEFYIIPKSDLEVTAFYDDGTSKKLNIGDYRLDSDTIAVGSSNYTGTVIYEEHSITCTDEFQVDVSLPQPKPKYKVTFNLDGGMIDVDGSGNLIDTLEVMVKEGNVVEQPKADPVKDGYDFLGWVTKAGVITETGAKTYAYDFTEPITGDVVVYAAWIEDATELTIGYTFNSTIKLLVGELSKVKEIQNTDQIPAGATTKVVSTTSSYKEAKAYFDEGTGILYIATDAERIYVNENAYNMFSFCNALTNIDALSNWDASNVRNMSWMFYQCKALTNVDGLSNWNVSNVTNMKLMFSGCYALTNIDGLSNWDVSSVTDMSTMFSSCKELTNIDGLSNWDASSVTDMSWMFYQCKALTNVGALSNWNVSNITIMDDVFRECISLGSLNALSNWDVSNVTTMDNIFLSCKELTNIDALSNWDVSNVTNMSSMFSSCKELTNIDVLSNWNVNNVTIMDNMFQDCSSLTNIDALSNWNVSNVTNMSSMFYQCKTLTNIDALSNWNVSNVTNMRNMFYACNVLPNVDSLSSWDVSSVTIMMYMFSSCSALTNIDALSNWNVNNVTNMSYMFSSCSALTNIGALSNWNVNNVTNMSSVFSSCKALTNVDVLSNWKVSNVTIMDNMFQSCSSLTNIDALSNWDVSNVTNMSSMFYQCKALTNIDALSNWDVSNVTNMNYMFYDCAVLTDASGINDWNILKVTSFNGMFRNCLVHPEFTKRPGTWNGSGTFIPTN